jgi:hypothetical protein
MRALSLALQTSALVVATLSVGSCGSSNHLAGRGEPAGSQPAAAAQPTAPPVNVAGRWLLSSPGRGGCAMMFSAASTAAVTGVIAPEGGCPGKFFTSRKWTYDAGGLVIHDHTGAPLARLSLAGSGFDGTAGAGEPVTMTR